MGKIETEKPIREYKETVLLAAKNALLVKELGIKAIGSRVTIRVQAYFQMH